MGKELILNNINELKEELNKLLEENKEERSKRIIESNIIINEQEQQQEKEQKEKYNKIRIILNILELAFLENEIIDSSFYSLNMIIFLIQGDLYGGKYLWKRSPNELKIETTEFYSLWSICKALLQKSILEAYQIIHNTKWSNFISSYIIELHSTLQYQSINTLQSSYSEVNLLEMSGLLDLTPEQTIEFCATYGWNIRSLNESETQLVEIPKRSIVQSSAPVSQLQLLQTFTEFNSILETASLPYKFDLRPGLTLSGKGSDRNLEDNDES